jgi:hypothetical protein
MPPTLIGMNRTPMIVTVLGSIYPLEGELRSDSRPIFRQNSSESWSLLTGSLAAGEVARGVTLVKSLHVLLP